ncbi:phosphoribosylamine--glycine ligase [Flavobacteriales bacterium]|nr:phosphoribosylamine--glycine ligase [Flavobacteriales bacterium]
MNILILGSGGREHAISWKLAQSPKLTKLFIAPGNAGTEELGENVDLSVSNFDGIAKFSLENKVEMIVVGPEVPLVQGIHDFFEEKEELKHIHIIGPKKLGAQLEGSKKFSKEFMQRHNIPTARYKAFTAQTLEDGFAFLETLNPPFVLKADGLAAGKGVVIPDNLADAKKELTDMLANSKFGAASQEVVIEEFLNGIELSVFVLTDGENYKVLPTAKDYKRIGEGDKGLNTGGMGAISPVPFATKEFLDKVEEQIVKPSVNGLKKDNIDYVGFLFIGLMNVCGDPFVIEYNVRMGDPETEVVIPRIESDLVEVFTAVGNKTLNEIEFKVTDQTVCTVMAVSGGYPESYEKLKVIEGIEGIDESVVFHAGTKVLDGKIVTNGGRVLAISSFGANKKEALDKSYASLNKIGFEKMYYRTDIGFDLK